MTTFSQLVDKILLETRRPDLLGEICTYLNQTIRELHFTPQVTSQGYQPTSGNAILYRENLTEVQLTADVETGYTWTIVDPTNFQAMLAVRYDSVWLDDDMLYPPEKTPGRGLYGMVEFYYRAGSTYAFAGYGGDGGIISLAYYQYPKSLKYKASSPNARPATYDVESGWTYYTVGAVDYDDDDDSRELAQLLTTNWLLVRWDTVVEEGLRAKVYKRVGDDTRAKLSYSMYTTLRQGLFTSESADLGGYV
jgi:hypothetical protein